MNETTNSNEITPAREPLTPANFGPWVDSLRARGVEVIEEVPEVSAAELGTR